MGRRAFFNVLAEKWDTICCHDRERIYRILELTGVGNGDTVLDVGTGTGILIPFLQERIGPAGAIDAVDIAEAMLAVARGKTSGHNVTFIHGDIMELPLAREHYDQIICYSVFPHLRDKNQAVMLLSGYLKPGGRLTVAHSQSRKAINHLHKNASRTVANDHLPGMETIIKLFWAAGLEPVSGVDNEDMFVVSGRKPDDSDD
jgi:ubiquinone/menaquinone biosynthesis C-methylase UbiE